MDFAETWKTRLAGASTGGESVEYTNEKAQLATVAWLKARLGKYRYSQDLVKRLDPDKYGETVCVAGVRLDRPAPEWVSCTR